jgi:hypothetical protein
MPAPGTPGTAVSIEDGAYQLTVNPAFGGIYQISVQLGAAEIGEGDFPLRAGGVLRTGTRLTLNILLLLILLWGVIELCIRPTLNLLLLIRIT